MVGKITSEHARKVQLPFNPFARNHEVRRLLEEMGVEPEHMHTRGLPFLAGRADLVWHAEVTEIATKEVEKFYEDFMDKGEE